MDTVVWLWLYDKRWMFGIKAPNVMKIWAAPLVMNVLFFGALLYYSYEHNNDVYCYSDFKSWIDVRMYLLIAMIVCLTCIMLKASNKMHSERIKLYASHKMANELSLRYTYWLRRRVIMSFSGLILIILGLLNWLWTLYGMNLVYERFNAINRCGNFMQNVVWGNLVLTGVFAFPVIWIMFWMITIKCISLIMSVVWPSSLIWIKKKTAKPA